MNSKTLIVQIFGELRLIRQIRQYQHFVLYGKMKWITKTSYISLFTVLAEECKGMLTPLSSTR